MAKTKTHQWKGEKKRLSAHLNFSQKINFCPLYSWVIASVNSANPQGGGGGAVQWGGWRVCCYLLQQALIPCSTSFVRPLVQHLRKTSPGQSPLFPPGCWFVAPWPHVQAVMLRLANKPRWHDPSFFFRKNTKKERKHESVMLFLLVVFCAQWAGRYFRKQRLRRVTGHQTVTQKRRRRCRGTASSDNREGWGLSVDRYHMIEWERAKLKVAVWA